MHFFETLIFETALFSASLLANANPIKRQASETVTITELEVQFMGDSYINSATFTIETSSENITCGAEGVVPALYNCSNSDSAWQFTLTDFEGAVFNLTLYTEIDSVTVSGNTSILTYCMGDPNVSGEISNCGQLYTRYITLE